MKMVNEITLSGQIKILCFSDWRKNELVHIADLIKNHSPDIVLYGGDDLKRFIPTEFFDVKPISKFRIPRKN